MTFLKMAIALLLFYVFAVIFISCASTFLRGI